MPEETLSKTPLHRCHLQLGARMVPFAGYSMPVQYTGVLEETKAVRENCGLFDVSHMGQFSLHGKNSLDAVMKLVTNDLTKLGVGQAQYNMLCNEKGGVIDDLVVYRRTEDWTYICVNASNRQTDFQWMKSHLSNVSLEDESDATGLLALQGPKAEQIISRALPPQVAASLKYYWACDTKLFDLPCYLSRTGYTGEDGFELYIKATDAADIWERLLELGRKDGLVPCGLGARDTLRLEMGYPLHGHELSQEISPLEAGLGWVVKLDKTVPFIGQSALKKEAAAGPARQLKALVVQDRRIARQGYHIVTKNREPIGTITSGTHSPHLNTPIALGFVKKEFAKEEKYHVEVRESLISANAQKLPFVPSHTKKH